MPVRIAVVVDALPEADVEAEGVADAEEAVCPDKFLQKSRNPAPAKSAGIINRVGIPWLGFRAKGLAAAAAAVAYVGKRPALLVASLTGA